MHNLLCGFKAKQLTNDLVEARQFLSLSSPTKHSKIRTNLLKDPYNSRPTLQQHSKILQLSLLQITTIPFDISTEKQVIHKGNPNHL